MKKVLKWIVIALVAIVTIIILAGMYKFNYLGSQEGYDCDGNKITSDNTKTPVEIDLKNLKNLNHRTQ